MERQMILGSLSLLFVTSALGVVIDPRGARPMEHGFKADKCATEKEWPFCTDDDWGPKCPSGCRIQGLLDKYDHEILKKIEKIRSLLEQYQAKHRSADQVSKQTYDYLKDKLTTDAGKDNNYYDLAQNLRQRIVDMKIKIDRQLRSLQDLKDSIKNQVIEMHRLEVDIDIKLRACKGSCQSYREFSVDQESYVALDKQMEQLESRSGQSVHTVNTLYVMKSRALKDVEVNSVFKSSLDVDSGTTTAEQRQDFFPEVSTNQLTLEVEGASPASPATVSKVPGTPISSSSSSSSFTSSSSGSQGHRSGSGTSGTFTITPVVSDDGFFGGFEAATGGQPATSHVSSQTTTVGCSQSTRTTVVHTKSGPVERTETVSSPGCGILMDSTKGLGPLMTSLTSSSSSHSLHSSSVKGSLMDSKTGLSDPFGFDLGGFMVSGGDDDVPDFHARSVKSVRVERQADYEGKDCADIQQRHLSGESNGLFKVKPAGLQSNAVVEVYCKQEGIMGGWLLVQQRENGELSFNRTWSDYRDGFGSVDARGKGEVWLGNQNLHLLTNRSETMLRVELEDWEGGVADAEYTFRVGSEAEGYPLYVLGYTGDAGDALVRGEGGLGSFLSHDRMKFSTFDRDSDRWEENCAEMFGGGWWYNNCQSANLNGVYYKGRYEPEKNTPYEVENGVVWLTYKPADYSLKSVRMFIRPAAF